MVKFGMSSSCFYPLEMKQSFLNVIDTGMECCEVFINTKSEFKKEFTAQLVKLKNASGIDIVSLHPYTSFAENTMLFSSYKQRFTDFFIDDLQLHFEAAAALGAKYYVLHGMREGGSICEKEYFERFAKIVELSKSFGLLAVQENVVHLSSQNPDFLVRMKNYIGDDLRLVLDIKQALRANFSPFEFIEKLGNIIAHIHISDHNKNKDCILPLSGFFDFPKLFKKMNSLGYDGAYIIELYESGYNSISDIIEAKNELEILYHATIN